MSAAVVERSQREMSLVGPRPLPYYHLNISQRISQAALRACFQAHGSLQVSARSDGDLRVQEALDGYYIRNWSPCWTCTFWLALLPQ